MSKVSIIIPAYFSDETLRRAVAHCLDQTLPPLEVVVVDSTPGANAPPKLPATVRYFTLGSRLLPHQARNFGAAYARGDLLVFTDPDIYPERTWLAELVGAWQQTGGIVYGALVCYGQRWLDVGAHFCKFHICLPGAPAAPIDYGWSGAMLVEPGVFRRAGGFPDTYWAGDTMLSGRLRQAGYTLWFASSAIAAHDHLQLTLRALVRERFLRGREFGRMAVGGLIGSERLTDFELLRKALTTVTLPLLVLLALGNIARQAAQAGKLRSFLWTLPVVAAGRAAWALGVAAGYWDEVFQRRHLPQPS